MPVKREVKKKVSSPSGLPAKEVRAKASPTSKDPVILVSKDANFTSVYVTNATVSMSQDVIRITCWDEYPSHLTLPNEPPKIEKVAKVQIIVPITQLEILLEEIIEMRDMIHTPDRE